VRPGDIGQLGNRFREQARFHRKQDQKIAAFGSSYIGIECRQLGIGWLFAVIAGKPAPTGIECDREILVSWETAFAGKLAPTESKSKINRSRPSAAPTFGLGVGSWGLGGCQAVIAGKPAPTEGRIKIKRSQPSAAPAFGLRWALVS
jgi:hypothetical protein